MNKKIYIITVLAFLYFSFFFLTMPALAENPPASGNATEEGVYQEAQRIAAELRCPVCTGQSLVESNSDVAQEMRAKVLEMVRQGKTRQEIIDHFVGQYGDWILNSPPARGAGLVAWLVPPAALVIGALVLVWFVRRRQPRPHDAGGGPSTASGTPLPTGGGLDRDAEISRKVQERLRDYL